MRVGPGWLYTGALSPAESVEAQRVTWALLRLWHARRASQYAAIGGAR